MAFTKTPTQDTYDTKRFPLVGQPLQRNGTDALKDQRFLNCFPEYVKAQVSDAKKFYVKKRPGLSRKQTPGAGDSRGMIWEDTTAKLFFVVGSSLYVYDGATLTLITNTIPNVGPVGMCIHLTTSISIILLTGNAGYVINPVTNSIVQIVDPDFPLPHLPFPISMDGYLFVAAAGTADIYNSDLDDPMAWTAGNFIRAEMYPDNIIAMTKNNNYVIAVGTGSMEFFYDAGTATGSPLARNDSAVQQIGTGAAYSVVQTEKEVVLVGSTANGGRTVWMVEGFNATEVATEGVRMSLNDIGVNLGFITAFCIRIEGHKFYVLRLPTQDRTWVYDMDTKLWHEWSTSIDINDTQDVFLGKYAADSNLGFPYLLSEVGNLYLMDDTTYQDDSQTIKMQITTLKLDFDNMNRKFMYRLSLYGDWPLNTTSTMSVEWSDDDYRTWSVPRNLQLSTDLPVIRRGGWFRRRAFRLTHTGNVPVRLEGMELDMNNGVS